MSNQIKLVMPRPKDNGCSFYLYCLNEGKNDSACMHVPYYIDKLKRFCKPFDLKQKNAKKALKENYILKEQRKEEEKLRPVLKIKKRNKSVTHVYLNIFEAFNANPITDKEIANDIEAFCGARPTNRNIASYRCNYNKGKIKGQIGIPKTKVQRLKKRKK